MSEIDLTFQGEGWTLRVEGNGDGPPSVEIRHGRRTYLMHHVANEKDWHWTPFECRSTEFGKFDEQPVNTWPL